MMRQILFSVAGAFMTSIVTTMSVSAIANMSTTLAASLVATDINALTLAQTAVLTST